VRIGRLPWWSPPSSETKVEGFFGIQCGGIDHGFTGDRSENQAKAGRLFAYQSSGMDRNSPMTNVLYLLCMKL
jgi:hypothetical protein